MLLFVFVFFQLSRVESTLQLEYSNATYYASQLLFDFQAINRTISWKPMISFNYSFPPINDSIAILLASNHYTSIYPSVINFLDDILSHYPFIEGVVLESKGQSVGYGMYDVEINNQHTYNIVITEISIANYKTNLQNLQEHNDSMNATLFPDYNVWYSLSSRGVSMVLFVVASTVINVAVLVMDIYALTLQFKCQEDLKLGITVCIIEGVGSLIKLFVCLDPLGTLFMGNSISKYGSLYYPFPFYASFLVALYILESINAKNLKQMNFIKKLRIPYVAILVGILSIEVVVIILSLLGIATSSITTIRVLAYLFFIAVLFAFYIWIIVLVKMKRIKRKKAYVRIAQSAFGFILFLVGLFLLTGVNNSVSVYIVCFFLLWFGLTFVTFTNIYSFLLTSIKYLEKKSPR